MAERTKIWIADAMKRLLVKKPLQKISDVLSIESAAAAMNSMRQDYIFYKRAYEDNSQSPMWSYMNGC